MEGMERALQNPTYHTPISQRIFRKRGRRGGTRKKKTKGQLNEGIFNLAGASFSDNELQVLSQGLKFAPDKNLNKFELFIDVEKYVRKLNIKKFFAIQRNTCPPVVETDKYKHSGLRNNSIFNPQKGTHHHIEVFKHMVQDEIKSLEIKKARTKRSLVEGIKQLEENKNIVVRPADKGGGVVILTKEDYYGEIQRLLKDTSTYKPLASNPLNKLKIELHNWIDKGVNQKILDVKEAQYLLPKVPRTPVLYVVPKIHKNKEKPPGRPIVSGIGSLYSRVGEYLDMFLQPLVKQGKSYLKDSRELIKSLSNIQVTDATIMVTVDIESLYTNIRQEDALVAVQGALTADSHLKKAQINFLVEGLKIAMGNNYFWAQGVFYNQIKGVAMGARYAPSVANMVLNKWEGETIYKDKPIPLLYYKRYIDDVVLLWEGSPITLHSFIQNLNSNQYGLRFTAEFSLTTINYLDLTLVKQKDRIGTKTFFKATDRNAFVPTNSCHHPQWLGAIPKGQFMRIRRNCAEESDYITQASILTERFREKGYCEVELTRAKNVVAAMDRYSLLESKNKTTMTMGTLPFITGFNRQYKSIEKIFKKFWPILQKDRDLVSVIPSKPRFIYRKAPGLRNIIAPNVPDPPDKPPTFLDGSGFHYCTRCKACRTTIRRTRKVTKFKSSVTQEEFNIKPLITCYSKHVTYVLECPCSLQYVGRTTRELRIRINEHVANIAKGFPNHSVSRHFLLHHNRDPRQLVFYGIDRVTYNWRGTDLTKAVSQNETQWLFRLSTMQPLGLNIDLDLNCFLTNE